MKRLGYDESLNKDVFGKVEESLSLVTKLLNKINDTESDEYIKLKKVSDNLENCMLLLEMERK